MKVRGQVKNFQVKIKQRDTYIFILSSTVCLSCKDSKCKQNKSREVSPIVTLIPAKY